MRPSSDPTRTGALWVGGAGVALLLAAAAVLTAVRWDEIGQSVKLGGLVAITLAMLAGGRKLRDSIPMTGEAIFHLGALLIPFDMAAVAILAGQTWQQTLMLTSLTSVVAWYGIDRASPSKLLRWCAHGSVVAAAAGIAALTPVTMPLALAACAVIALAIRQPLPAAVWATIAGLLQAASLVYWPVRLAAYGADLGFVNSMQWQHFIAGLVAFATLAATTRLLPRVEVAWATVLVASITTLTFLWDAAELSLGLNTIAGLFVVIELTAMLTRRDPLWAPVVRAVALVAEGFAAGLTSAILFIAVLPESWFESADSLPVAAGLLALGWLTADTRRLDDGTDWLIGALIGADWPATTLMFPLAILAILLSLHIPIVVGSLVCLALAYWMIATWRTGAEAGASILVVIAAAAANGTEPWLELGLGGLGALVLMLASGLAVRRKNELAAIGTAGLAAFIWIAGAVTAILDSWNEWPLALVVAGLWALSWLTERTSGRNHSHGIDFFGRTVAASLVLGATFLGTPISALASCAVVLVMATLDHQVFSRGRSNAAQLQQGYAILGGATLGVAGVSITSLAGLATAPGGLALTLASFVALGLALALHKDLELPLGVSSIVLASLGVLMASGDLATLAPALIVAGISLAFGAAAARNQWLGIAAFATIGVGVAGQLAEWQVDWVEPYLVFPAVAALAIGHRYHRAGGSSWVAYTPVIVIFSYVSMAARFTGGSAWHTVIAGAVAVFAIIAGGYRRLAGPLLTGSAILAIVAIYESLGPSSRVPTWAWLALGGTILLGAGMALERTDTTPLERGQQLRRIIATQYS